MDSIAADVKIYNVTKFTPNISIAGRKANPVLPISVFPNRMKLPRAAIITSTATIAASDLDIGALSGFGKEDADAS